MRIAVDTNAYVDFCRGESHAVQVIRRADNIILPFITVGELRAGFLCGNQKTANEKNMSRFLHSPRVSVIFPDEQTTHHYAFIFHFLKTQGTPIPTNDLWIGALVRQHDLILFTRDRHFDSLPFLPRISQ